MTDTVKPGFRTTEFWLSLIATLGSLLISSGLISSIPVLVKIVALIVALLASIGYTSARVDMKVSSIEASLKQRE